MAGADIYTRDWAENIVQELSQVASAETDDQILSILRYTAMQLDDFLGEFNLLRNQIENLGMRKSIVRKFRRQITSDNMNSIAASYEDAQENAEATALYASLLNKMIIGYYLINKIRDIFFEPITYAIGFKDENGETLYIDNLELDDLLQGTMSLSTRIRMSEQNFARLEIDLKQLLQKLKDENKLKQAGDDPLYRDIMEYASQYKHTYQSRSGKYHSEKMKAGYLWEVYRSMKAQDMSVSGDNVQTIYEGVRTGNLAYFKGGDVLNEQDKFGTTVALASMASIVQQMPLIIEGLRSANTQQVASALSSIFLQRITDTTDKHIQNYVQKDTDKLLSILHLKT